MSVGGNIADLEAGDILTSIDLTITPFMARTYSHGVEELHERFHSGSQDRPQIAPPTFVHTMQLSVMQATCPSRGHDGMGEVPGRGRQARLHTEYSAKHYAHIPVGEPLVAGGVVGRRFQKRGREYIEIHYELRKKSDGALLAEYRHTAALSVAGAGGEDASATDRR